jgi:hypothetical protein
VCQKAQTFKSGKTKSAPNDTFFADKLIARVPKTNYDNSDQIANENY